MTGHHKGWRWHDHHGWIRPDGTPLVPDRGLDAEPPPNPPAP